MVRVRTLQSYMEVHPDSALVPAVFMGDEVGIVYLIETAQQFWSGEPYPLDHVLTQTLPRTGRRPQASQQRVPDISSSGCCSPTIPVALFSIPWHVRLRDTIHRNWSACSEQYLQTPLQLEHAFQMLLDSELFEFHSERMCEIIIDDTQAVSPLTNTALSLALHLLMDVFYIEHWSTLAIHLLQRVVLARETEAGFFQVAQTLATNLTITHGSYRGRHWFGGRIHIHRCCRNFHWITGSPCSYRGQASDNLSPIAVWGVRDAEFFTSRSPYAMFYFALSDKSWVSFIGIFDDDFIDQLFDLVEQTRSMQDDTFNYSVIKLIVCFLVWFVPRWLLRTRSGLTERTIHGRFPLFWLPTLW